VRIWILMDPTIDIRMSLVGTFDECADRIFDVLISLRAVARYTDIVVGGARECSICMASCTPCKQLNLVDGELYLCGICSQQSMTAVEDFILAEMVRPVTKDLINDLHQSIRERYSRLLQMLTFASRLLTRYPWTTPLMMGCDCCNIQAEKGTQYTWFSGYCYYSRDLCDCCHDAVSVRARNLYTNGAALVLYSQNIIGFGISDIGHHIHKYTCALIRSEAAAVALGKPTG